ncbi:MAG: hypothetical protein GQ582_04785 [Methyloprofundus sp.]|nr:hypothetical protein [Methyloprofundus sp.]
MKIDIYTSAKDGSKYLSIPVGSKLEKVVLPSDIDTDLLTLSPFKTRLEIEPDKKHKALDQKDIMQQIENNGYAVHGTSSVITLTAGTE